MPFLLYKRHIFPPSSSLPPPTLLSIYYPGLHYIVVCYFHNCVTRIWHMSVITYNNTKEYGTLLIVTINPNPMLFLRKVFRSCTQPPREENRPLSHSLNLYIPERDQKWARETFYEENSGK